MSFQRRIDQDVTGTVQISNPSKVHDAVADLMLQIDENIDLAPLSRAFKIYSQLYAGDLPGYVGCDTWYHDAQHSLDATLCYARLIHGHETTVAADERLGSRRCLLGVIIALFHDAGYIRKTEDREHLNGSEFTLDHVGRSGDFLLWCLPQIGFSEEAEAASHIVHFTGYEIQLDRIDVHEPKDRKLGFFLGTADLLSQMSDRCYLEKCRDLLYREFEICGLAGDPKGGRIQPAYSSPEDLLKKTPEFNRGIWKDRLNGYFERSYEYLTEHFGGQNPYLDEINVHMSHLDECIQKNDFSLLRRQYKVIAAPELSAILHPSGS